MQQQQPNYYGNSPGNGYYQKNYNDAPLPPLSTGSHFIAAPVPTYHHESCFCYECQDYNRRQHEYNNLIHQQQQQQQQQQQPPHSSSPSSTQQYNLPPQMSDNIGKRIHDYINDRRRILGTTPTSSLAYNNDAIIDGYNYNNNNSNSNWSWGQGGGSNQPSPSGIPRSQVWFMIFFYFFNAKHLFDV
jgi:hypothetical protein